MSTERAAAGERLVDIRLPRDNSAFTGRQPGRLGRFGLASSFGN
jgi:hypothetical protein